MQKMTRKRMVKKMAKRMICFFRKVFIWFDYLMVVFFG